MASGESKAFTMGKDSQSVPEPGETSGVRTRLGGASQAADSAAAVLSREHFLVLSDAARNPRATEIETEAAEIAERVGLLQSIPRARFDAFNCLVGYVYPTADVDAAVTCTLWCNWLFFFDDIHDEDLSFARNVSRVRDRMEHHLGVLLGVVAVPTPDPFEKLTLEFRTRALEHAGRAWLSRFGEVVDGYLFQGVLPSVENWIHGRTPSVDEYLVQRDHDSAVLTAIDLIEIAHGISISDEVRNSPLMRSLRMACTRTIGCFNDIVSYPKEVLRHKNPNNLVHVLAHEWRCSVRQALHGATDIVNESAFEQLRLERQILDDLPTGPHPVRTYLKAMRTWQRGNIEHGIDSGRYHSRWSPLIELWRPELEH